ncbi:hypothetical protein LWC35_13075 [Pseudonocardia kujensis]|uniref:hypothetical protein n=1 Tax=Pseudonocardia kujensis TaxID=1128675 RepID=UPI001E3818B9|nr:hypothetical protein [Pseudonocardia kujensis]MCE0763834.1 hypothetical protein [Pseudonocardia kujensis]
MTSTDRPTTQRRGSDDGGDGDGARPHPREMFIGFLLDTVRQDPFPSGTQLDLIEESIPAHMVPEYVEVLIEKSREGCFPSTDVLRRIQRMSAGPGPAPRC